MNRSAILAILAGLLAAGCQPSPPLAIFEDTATHTQGGMSLADARVGH